MAERSTGGGSPDPRIGSHDPTRLEDRLEDLFVALRDGNETEAQVRELEDLVSGAIGEQDEDTLFQVYVFAMPNPDRANRTINENLYILHRTVEIALRGIAVAPTDQEYEQLAKLARGIPVELEDGSGGMPVQRELIFGLEEKRLMREDDTFGFELTRRGLSTAEIWARDFPEINQTLKRQQAAQKIGRIVRPIGP